MAALQIGDVKPKELYIGNYKIKEAWLGNTKLWSSSVPTLVTVGNKGKIYYSLDMKTWNLSTVISSLVNNGESVTITSDGNKFVILTIYNGIIYSFYSEDGINWTSVTSTGMIGNPTSIEYKQGIFVASSTAGLYYSYDGVNWQRTITDNMNKVKYLNGRFISVGQVGKSYYSFDGINWTAMTITSAVPESYKTLNYIDVEYGNNSFIMTAKSSANSSVLLISYDFITWSKRTSPNAYITSFACGKGKFVGVGDGTIDASSYKLISYQNEVDVESVWNMVYNPIKSLLQVKYIVELGKFIAVGDRSAYYSIDGVSWTAMTGLNADDYVKYWESSYKE